MGATLGAAARANGARVIWAEEGRSWASQARARAAGLEPVANLDSLVQTADVIVSVCPPHGAEAVAMAVIAAGFKGLYCDANAIRPERARRLAAAVTRAGGRFVDGGIIGLPPRVPGAARLYLSGADAEDVARLFQGSLHEPIVVSGDVGAASALKMSYAAYNKGRIALALAVRALARASGVEDALRAEWARSAPSEADRIEADGPRIAGKAWRWVGEMEEIAATFEDAGLPPGFHEGAGEIYEAMADFKDAERSPSFDAVMGSILAAARDVTRR
jgi:3-hydroxyisobutyrate dehydrogenase-like beta-hydroxyacid dehydrogenase